MRIAQGEIMFPNPTSPSIGTGYTCSSCGQWISGGMVHFCPNIPAYPAPITNVFIDHAVLERIAKALESIAAHLTLHAADGASAPMTGEEFLKKMDEAIEKNEESPRR
jgi:hypothetical protein